MSDATGHRGPGYQLGIDLGTTFTAAVVCRDGDPHPHPVPLAAAAAAVASVVFLAPDGTFVVGEAAGRRALTDPTRVAREFKRRIGDDIPVAIGGHAVPAEVLAARFVEWVVAEAARREGGPADAVTITHPAEWGSHRRAAFAAALSRHGLDDVGFVSEPQAAAIGYASTERIEPGGLVAVYDLGGGTFDAAVVRKSGEREFELLGRPSGIERLGGIDFDERILAHVRDVIGDPWSQLDVEHPAVRAAVSSLRRECTVAKESLSVDTEAMIPVMLPGIHTQVRLGRAEFEDMIRPLVTETVEALRRAIASAGVEPAELEAVLLVGGSSRIPLVAQLVSAELGRSIAVDADPKAVVATGAALTARAAVAPPAPALPVPVPGAGPETPMAYLHGAPDSPPLDLECPLAGNDEPDTSRRRRLLATVAAVAVLATFATTATVATATGPAGTTTGVAARGGPFLDPW
ncbi:MAG TPA: Hsp70 family protein, partial [Pseudonocardia sp.]|nr:Hsp70 family protein [Pseudonocardia sp.]